MHLFPLDKGMEREKYLQGIPGYLIPSVRAIVTIFKEVTTERRLKKFSNSSHVYVAHQDIHKLTLSTLERLLELRCVKDVNVWNMKNSDMHGLLQGVEKDKGDTVVPCDALRPIVVECECYGAPNDDKEHGDPIKVGRMFREDFKKQMNVNAQVIARMSDQLPFSIDGVVTQTPALLDAIKKVMSLLFIEFSESIPHVKKCEDINYKAFTASGEKLHCFTITNPPRLSARKLLYINTTFVMHIRTIQFSTRMQPQTRNVDAVVLSVVFGEPHKGDGKGIISGYYKANTGVKISSSSLSHPYKQQ